MTSLFQAPRERARLAYYRFSHAYTIMEVGYPTSRTVREQNEHPSLDPVEDHYDETGNSGISKQTGQAALALLSTPLRGGSILTLNEKYHCIFTRSLLSFGMCLNWSMAVRVYSANNLYRLDFRCCILSL